METPGPVVALFAGAGRDANKSTYQKLLLRSPAGADFPCTPRIGVVLIIGWLWELPKVSTMYRTVSEVETQFRFGVHSEWNVRELQVRELLFGRKYVSWVFRDDGPVLNGRRRHTSIPLAFVLPAQIDWPRFKTNLWYYLEGIKAYC